MQWRSFKRGSFFFLLWIGLVPYMVLASENMSVLTETATAESIPEWYMESPDGNPVIGLYFFWSTTCPHCHEAAPYLQKLKEEFPWLRLHSFQVRNQPENLDFYKRLATPLGQPQAHVPAFLFCEKISVGYLNDEVTGTTLRQNLMDCYSSRLAALQEARRLNSAKIQMSQPASQTHPQSFLVPVFGSHLMDVRRYSLPVLTLVLASLDSFNPCAFFVLLFLLSLLVHVRSRKRMLVIGGIFVLFSGVFYFVFMAAWLNAFLLIGNQRMITSGAGVLASLMALVNIKDFFYFRQGVSLSMSDKAKNNLYSKMRSLVYAGNWPMMILGTISLAAAANTYEFLCTSGFPMVFTRALTLRALPPLVYYGYLGFYNLVYVLPLLFIVLLFVWKLGSRKLTEEEGRFLKLLSGLMMLVLGIILVAAPDALTDLRILIGSIVGVILLACSLYILSKRMSKISEIRNAN